jgi:hypothetical protein
MPWLAVSVAVCFRRSGMPVRDQDRGRCLLVTFGSGEATADG